MPSNFLEKAINSVCHFVKIEGIEFFSELPISSKEAPCSFISTLFEKVTKILGKIEGICGLSCVYTRSN